MRYGVLGSREVVYYCRMGGKSGRVGEKRKEQLAILVRSCLGWAVSTYIKYIRQERGTTNGNRKKKRGKSDATQRGIQRSTCQSPKEATCGCALCDFQGRSPSLSSKPCRRSRQLHSGSSVQSPSQIDTCIFCPSAWPSSWAGLGQAPLSVGSFHLGLLQAQRRSETAGAQDERLLEWTL